MAMVGRGGQRDRRGHRRIRDLSYGIPETALPVLVELATGGTATLQAPVCFASSEDSLGQVGMQLHGSIKPAPAPDTTKPRNLDPDGTVTRETGTCLIDDITRGMTASLVSSSVATGLPERGTTVGSCAILLPQ